jgi:hypothetical protein
VHFLSGIAEFSILKSAAFNLPISESSQSAVLILLPQGGSKGQILKCCPWGSILGITPVLMAARGSESSSGDEF